MDKILEEVIKFVEEKKIPSTLDILDNVYSKYKKISPEDMFRILKNLEAQGYIRRRNVDGTKHDTALWQYIY